MSHVREVTETYIEKFNRFFDLGTDGTTFQSYRSDPH